LVPADGATGVDGNPLQLVLFSDPIRHASLDAADGLTLTRGSTGQMVVGMKTVAGHPAVDGDRQTGNRRRPR
jgi:hypothetical protein